MKKIEITPTSIVKPLALIFILILSANIFVLLAKFIYTHDHLKGLSPLFNMSEEQNIPTFFTSLLLIIIAIFLATTAKIYKLKNNLDSKKWTILSAGFLLMAYDESFQLHEQLIEPTRKILNTKENLGIFYYSWVIPGLALTTALGLYFLKFIFRLPSATRLIFIIAGLLYLGGAIGFELIGGSYKEVYGTKNLTYHLISTTEESLEIIGLILFLYGLLKHISTEYNWISITFNSIKKSQSI